MNALQYRHYGHTGVRVSVLGFGTGRLALPKTWVTRHLVSVLKWLFLKDVVLEPH